MLFGLQKADMAAKVLSNVEIVHEPVHGWRLPCGLERSLGS